MQSVKDDPGWRGDCKSADASRDCCGVRSYSSANGGGLRFEPSQSIRDNITASASPDLVWNRKINPGMVFVLTLPLDQVAEGDRAMDERRAIKTMLRP
jgi:hypothetical protein